ncbi:kelch-like protein 10 [Protopterus annectens]|uniref:kelch-like protein 10 n=1 Tax=Protopterus annectens TaxID=7888 RepID=UPI001CFA3232|nr:kelch-like protein 10 [Protopterus annectens]
MIVNYSYTRIVDVTEDNVEELLIAADQFYVFGILRACCDFLESQLCLENCLGIWKFADCYYCPELKRKAIIFILRNFKEMVKVSQEFLQLSTFEFGEIIEKDELNVKQEEIVFNAILQWISFDSHNRKKCLSLLLPKVRLSRMNPNYFIDNVKNNDYVKDDVGCRPVIVDALKFLYDFNMSGPSDQDFSNPLTRPRFPEGVLFVTGGYYDFTGMNAIETYNARADRWVNSIREEGPLAFHSAVYLKGYVYIIGGFNGVENLKSVKCFDPVKKTWQQVASMHSRRRQASVTVLSDFIYIMGGFDSYNYVQTAERYDPKTNQWTLIPPMKEQRCAAAATTLQGKIYICGGANRKGNLSTAETYNPETNQWTFIAPMRIRRDALGVAAYGEHIYAVGGFDGDKHVNSAEMYNPLTNIWTTISNMSSPRSHFGIAVVDDLLFVVGGLNSNTISMSSAECYDENTGEWHSIHNMGIGRDSFGCCVVSGLPNFRDYAVPRDNDVGFSL